MKQNRRSKVHRKKTKTVLRLPDLEYAKTAVLNSLTSSDAQRGYRQPIDEFVDWYCSEPRLAFNRIVVLRYRNYLETRQLASGTINLRLGAVRRLAYEAADSGLLSSDLAAGIRRVKGVKKLDVRLGNWLTAEQGQALWQAPDSHRMKGKRDRSSVLDAAAAPALASRVLTPPSIRNWWRVFLNCPRLLEWCVSLQDSSLSSLMPRHICAQSLMHDTGYFHSAGFSP
jgi:hypothetical protein